MTERPHDQVPNAVLRGLGIRPSDLQHFSGLPGRVAIVHGARAEVVGVDEAGDERVATVDLPESLPSTLVAGDWVSLTGERITAVSPRRSELRRPRRRSGELQILAANIDLVLIVTPVDRVFNRPLLERLVVMAWDSGAQPVIVLSKVDEMSEAQNVRDEIASALADLDVVATSAVTGWGFERLRAMLHEGVTAVMLGVSGAGKTSILNTLEGSDHRIRSVGRSGEGRHATTTRRLHRLSSGGVLLDIPGIRLVDLKIDRATLDGAFSDIRALATECRFRDCAHQNEWGCAVITAVNEHRVAASRLELWRKLMQDLVEVREVPKPRNRRRAVEPDRYRWTTDDEILDD